VVERSRLTSRWRLFLGFPTLGRMAESRYNSMSFTIYGKLAARFDMCSQFESNSHTNIPKRKGKRKKIDKILPSPPHHALTRLPGGSWNMTSPHKEPLIPRQHLQAGYNDRTMIEHSGERKDNNNNLRRTCLEKEPLKPNAKTTTQSYRPHLGLLRHLDISEVALPLHDACHFFIGRNRVDTLGFPSCNSFLRLDYFSHDDLVLLAQLTLACDAGSFVYQLHTARFAGPVLFVAVGSETSPLVVPAREDLLVVETHGLCLVFQVFVDWYPVTRGGE